MLTQGTANAGDSIFYDFRINHSLRFDGTNYLSRNMSGTGQANWTFSLWVKRSTLGTNYLVGESYASHDAFIGFASDNKITVLDKYCSGTCQTNLSTTNSVFRDTSAFYHIVAAFNGSASSVSDGFKIYVNGQSVPSTASADSWPRNSTGWFLGTMYIGRSYSANYLKGYMANVQFIDGQTLNPYYFGEMRNNIWIPYNAFTTANSNSVVSRASNGNTAYDNYGSNGFHLLFDDLTDLGKDSSGNANNWY